MNLKQPFRQDSAPQQEAVQRRAFRTYLPKLGKMRGSISRNSLIFGTVMALGLGLLATEITLFARTVRQLHAPKERGKQAQNLSAEEMELVKTSAILRDYEEYMAKQKALGFQLSPQPFNTLNDIYRKLASLYDEKDHVSPNSKRMKQILNDIWNLEFEVRCLRGLNDDGIYKAELDGGAEFYSDVLQAPLKRLITVTDREIRRLNWKIKTYKHLDTEENREELAYLKVAKRSFERNLLIVEAVIACIDGYRAKWKGSAMYLNDMADDNLDVNSLYMLEMAISRTDGQIVYSKNHIKELRREIRNAPDSASRDKLEEELAYERMWLEGAKNALQNRLRDFYTEIGKLKKKEEAKG